MKDPHDPGTIDLVKDYDNLTRETPISNAYQDAFGREILSSVPVEPPLGYVKRPSIADQIRDAIRQASIEAHAAGAETEEEANDFDVDEDMEPTSPWENDFEVNPLYESLLALQSKDPRDLLAHDPSQVSQQAASPAAKPSTATPPKEGEGKA